MAFADVDGNEIIVVTDWSEKDLIKQISGSRWDSASKSWYLPLSWGSCVTLRGVFRERLEVGAALNEWAWNERKARVEPALALRDIYKLEILEPWEVAYSAFGGTERNLYPFQMVGAEFLATAGDALLADEMGTGKTIQTLAALWRIQLIHGDALPAIVICPNSVKSHWGARIQEWLPEATAYVVAGSAAERRKVLSRAAEDPRAIVVTNIESVRLMSRLAPYGSVRLKRCRECDRHGDPQLKAAQCESHRKELNEFAFRTCVLDEAHRVKDPKAKQTRAIWAVFHGDAVTRRWGLTGTPIANHPGDLWSVMHALAPHEYATKTKYIDRYAMLSWNAFGGMDITGLRPDTREEFFQFFDPRFRRMTKDLVLPQLPKKVRLVRNVEMSAKQKKAYKEISDRLVTTLDDGSILVARTNLTAMTRLLQFASSYCEITYGDDPEDVTGWKVRLREPSPKIDEMMEIIGELGAQFGTPVAIAAEHRQLIDLAATRLEEAKISHVLITGDVNEHQRTINLQRFSSGDVNIILFTYKAGGVGLDMSRAGTLIRLQRSWSLIDNKQGEDRVHRIGSEIHESVNIIDIVTSGTIEDTQTRRLLQKMARLEEITRDKARLAAAGQSVAELEREEEMIVNTHLGEA